MRFSDQVLVRLRMWNSCPFVLGETGHVALIVQLIRAQVTGKPDYRQTDMLALHQVDMICTRWRDLSKLIHEQESRGYWAYFKFPVIWLRLVSERLEMGWRKTLWFPHNFRVSSVSNQTAVLQCLATVAPETFMYKAVKHHRSSKSQGKYKSNPQILQSLYISSPTFHSSFWLCSATLWISSDVFVLSLSEI